MSAPLAIGGFEAEVECFGEVIRRQVEDYGRLTSLRVWYADGGEVEFGLSTPDWIAEPLDEGTAAVIAGGIKILYKRLKP